MDESPPGDTRARILRTALDLFSAHGYQRTTLQEIADRLRLTKAAILYHFPSKQHILDDLIEPLLAGLERTVDTAGRLPPERARWAILEGWVDVLLTHRRPLGMLFHDIAMIARGPTYQRLIRISLHANEVVAGPDADRRGQVRAGQAIAMCSDPVLFFQHVPPETLRADILDGVRRLFDGPADPADPADPEAATTRAPRRAGRPRALSSGQVAAARRMHAAGSHSVEEIAASLGVSRATVYRHLSR
ncbi:TetR family transcriptional regulator [Micromonospora sp. WMMD882]|uniref:TetR family transcriptional regulator n=1 Tax=Micromonospora sp. WMMD882 TaxID=3015151 RepID=UPI00248AA6B5|nr:TetR family transcriptional regulator [Micromonospora sp. WMMD882]WBB81045.1 TetR family transcriptional regulator [Micromonospora sp. WMMD882]